MRPTLTLAAFEQTIARMSFAPRSSSDASHRLAPYPDLEWIARIRTGDAVAFEALVNHYADRLCAFVYTMLRDTETTHELVQDIFLWIWRHRHDWEIRGALTTYLYRSARNRAVSHTRHERLQQRWQEEMAGDAAFEMVTRGPLHADAQSRSDDLQSALARALEQLPDRCRQVYLLSREHNLTYAQIGETLGISPKTVEVHMTRALASLRLSLADWLE